MGTKRITRLYAGAVCIILFITLLFCSSGLAQDSWNVELVKQIGGLCGAVFVKGNYSYIGEGRGLRILDTSNPSNPQPLGKVLLPEIVLGVSVWEDYAYVADGDAGLRLLR